MFLFFSNGVADSAHAQFRRRPDVVGRVRRLVLAFCALLVVACRGPVQPYEVLAPRVANLRAQFNADAGKVRIVILPAPT